ncbi:uncharacterized protein TRUGW13939_04746 [Talaromyces rugulosus]|uniref:Uncharacterized protein n=1 Tax=Talaromyces rugulosus TaxID=121627 RepID=A0A7H8QV72_TALRU|nr:uncharacterized protein TRUGW13939_04746 [Talaromyces rugulosus]QKX57628.1 hypothetical protein TRUGW13939_04746 [Talaromyces rugulosus]
MKTTLISLAGLTALGSMVAADTIPNQFFVITLETGGPKASLSGQYLDLSPVVDGTATVDFKASGDPVYYIDDDGKLVVDTFRPGGFFPVGPAYIDTDNNSILKFNNETTFDYAKFAVDNFTLVSENASDLWFWCPLDGSANGTVALGPTAGDGCEQVDTINVLYTD